MTDTFKMTGIFNDFHAQATQIREKYKYFAQGIVDSDVYSAEGKVQEQKKLSQDYKAKLDALRAEYIAAEEKAHTTLVNSVFVCRPAYSQGEYLQNVNAADNMKPDERQRAVKNALDIGAHDVIRAYGRSAYNYGDSATLRYIRDNAVASISEPLAELMQPPKHHMLEEAMAMGVFCLPEVKPTAQRW
jgi:hypothetical protein